VLRGFDRLRLRGTLRWLCYPDGLGKHLSAMKVLLKDFSTFAESLTQRIRGAAEDIARAAGRPLAYIKRPSESKEEWARAIAEADGVQEGLICVLYSVEPCRPFRIARDRERKQLVLQSALRQCSHYYFYWMHPTWGFCHARLQSWLPMTVNVCLNGREWLAHQMDSVGLGYQRRENCFTWLEDVAAAQRLMDAQAAGGLAERIERLAAAFSSHLGGTDGHAGCHVPAGTRPGSAVSAPDSTRDGAFG
jgi:hypothetical protein